MRRASYLFMALVGLGAGLFVGLQRTKAQSRQTRIVRILNEASSPIRYLYAASTGSKNWGEDRLGVFVTIETHHYMDTDLNDGTDSCSYSVKTVLYDKRSTVTNNFDACNVKLTITDLN
jgi:hypothetical protein